jgi:hypothetical protein
LQLLSYSLAFFQLGLPSATAAGSIIASKSTKRSPIMLILLSTPGGGTMADRWLYDAKNNEASYYQNGKYFYSSKTNECVYYEQSGYIYPMNAGTGAAFHINGKYWYTMSGEAAYYYG